MKDLECPYCDCLFNYDGDYDGFDQDSNHEFECPECYKIFGATVSWDVSFHEYETPCKNEGECIYKEIYRTPMVIGNRVGIRCKWCGDEKNIPYKEGVKFGYSLEEMEEERNRYDYMNKEAK